MKYPFRYPLILAALALLTLACVFSGGTPPSAAPPLTEIVIAPYSSPTPTPTAASLPSEAAIPGLTPSAAPVMAQALGDVNLRSGPALTFSVVGQLKAGDTVPVIGRSNDIPWYVVAWKDAPGGQAWVYQDVVDIVGDISAVPVETSAPAGTSANPSPVPTNPPAPAQPAGPQAAATPYGCQKPGDDYTLVSVGEGMSINRRTYTMLEHAQELYGGKHNFIKAITQGSYNAGVEASFGTHDGGGAVDLSVRDLSTFAVLTDQLPAIILALREAGFAAWVREASELGEGSPIHIHMIAIGDRDLSPAARRQLDGKEGYFRGYNGLPVDPPAADKWGAPILCPWMAELGYADLRITP